MLGGMYIILNARVSLECVKFAVLGEQVWLGPSPGALLYWEWSGCGIEGPGRREN